MTESFNIKIAKYLAIHPALAAPDREFSIADLARTRNLGRAKSRNIDRAIRNFVSVGFFGEHPLRLDGQPAVRKTDSNRVYYHGEGFITGLMEHPSRINYLKTIELLHYLERSVYATPGSAKGDPAVLDELETAVDQMGLDDTNTPHFYNLLKQGDYRELWFQRYGGPKPNKTSFQLKLTRWKIYPLIAAFLFATTAIAASRTYQLGLTELLAVLDNTGTTGLIDYTRSHKRGPWLWREAWASIRNNRPEEALSLLEVAESEPLRGLEKARTSYIRGRAALALGHFGHMQAHLAQASAHISTYEAQGTDAISNHKIAIEKTLVAMDQGRHALLTGNPEKALLYFNNGLHYERRINLDVPPEYVYHNDMHTILQRLAGLAEAAQGQHRKAFWRMIRVIESGAPDFNPPLTMASAFYYSAAGNIADAESCIGITVEALLDDPRTTQDALNYLKLADLVRDGRSTSPFLSFLDEQNVLDLTLALEAAKFQ